MKTLSFIALMCSCMYFSQIGIGIDTVTPTEVVDVKGTLRIRSLPNNGSTNVIYTTGTDTNSGDSPTQTFNAINPIVADANGILGKTTYANAIANNTTSGFNTTNSSSAFFVIRRYSIGDYPSINSGNIGFDTQMNVANWEAILSSVMLNFTTGTSGQQFGNGFTNNWRLKAGTTTWRIIGDVNAVAESGIIDILFIKKNIVASDIRTN